MLEKINLNRKIVKDIESNNIKSIQKHIENNVNLNDFFVLPLTIACRYGHVEMVKLLLDNGADVKLKNNEALIAACRYGHIEIVKLLIDKKADPKTENAFFSACRNGHFDIVKLLLKHGAPLNARNGYALTTASWNGHLEIVKFLLDQGVYINEELISAVKDYGHTDIVNLLREYINNKKVNFAMENFGSHCACGKHRMDDERISALYHTSLCSKLTDVVSHMEFDEKQFFNPTTEKFERMD